MNTIGIDDFNEMELCTGTILTAELFPEARKPAYKLLIDFGSRGTKKSSAQLTVAYKPQDLIGKQIVAVLNFPPRQIANFISECLVLGVPNAAGEIILLQTERQVSNGLRIS